MLKRSGFRQQSLQEIKEKQAIKREKDKLKPRKPATLKKSSFKTNTALASKKRATGQITPKKRKPRTLSSYKKELDRVFSIFIRQRDNGQCFTCSKKDDYKKMQNGHFVPRQYLSVRWDERNCNCQCYACNMLYGGQGATYAIRLKEKYGQETVEYLESQRWVSVKLDVAWYQNQIEKYKQLIT
jgi:5-methylcytosine-specific restriction endonuclease McrA